MAIDFATLDLICHATSGGYGASDSAFTLGAASTSLGLPARAVPAGADGETLDYCAFYSTDEYEIGVGAYTHSGTTLGRADVDISLSSNSNNRVAFSGAPTVIVQPLSGRLLQVIDTLLDLETGTAAGARTALQAQTLDATLTALAGVLTAANKIPYATGVDSAGELDFVDEDDMASDSATAVPSQSSVKAYADANPALPQPALYSDTDTATYSLGSNTSTNPPTPGSWVDMTGLEVAVTEDHDADTLVITASVTMDVTAGSIGRGEIGLSINGADPASNTIRSLDQIPAAGTDTTITTTWLYRSALSNADTISIKARTVRCSSSSVTLRCTGTHTLDVYPYTEASGGSRPILAVYGIGMGLDKQTESLSDGGSTNIDEWQRPYLDFYGLWDTSHFDYADEGFTDRVLACELAMGSFYYTFTSASSGGFLVRLGAPLSQTLHRFPESTNPTANGAAGVRSSITLDSSLVTGDIQPNLYVQYAGTLDLYINNSNLGFTVMEFKKQ